MTFLADGRRKPADADTVATHNGVLRFAVLVYIFHPHRLCIFRSELEYVADFNALFDCYRMLAANGADAAFGCLRNADVLDLADVSCNVQSPEMRIVLVCARNKRIDSLEGFVINNGYVLRQSYGTDKAGMNVHCFRNGCGVNVGTEMIAELCFVDFKVAADKNDDKGVIRIALIQNCLA